MEIKLLMDNLKYILYQILLPVIKLYSNEKIKFPNGHKMRQVLAYKVLDIILLLSLRIGPEQTRTEMETTLKAYFNVFSLVRSYIFSSENIISKPVQIEQRKNENSRVGFITAKQSFSRVGSINYKGRNSTFAKSQQYSKDFVQSFISTSDLNDSMDNSDPINSYDDFLKYSYDQTTNEIVGSSIKSIVNEHTVKQTLNIPYKFRSQSIGLLSLNDDDDHNSEDCCDSSKEASDPKHACSIKEENETATRVHKVDDDILNTFTSELAFTAYLTIARLNSGNYIDSILSNADLIHQMCLQDEQKRQKILSEQKKIPKIKVIIYFYASRIILRSKF